MTGPLAFLLPPLTALTGMRVNDLLFGRAALASHGAGLRFAWGLGTGMLIFSQLVVFGAVAGINLAAVLAWTALIWGTVEAAVRLWPSWPSWPAWRAWRPRHAHWWWLALLPVAAALVLTGLLATVEGTLEYDALAFWVFKAKVMFLKQGADFHAVHQNPLLTYAHWDYPLLVPGLYTLNYGLHGEVFEFTNKVWPFWMVTALLIAILSVSRFSARPRLLPVAVVTTVCFVRFTTYWVRMEGATVPMLFYMSVSALAATLWLLDRSQRHLAGLTLLLLAGCVATKFEGAVNAGFWGIALAVFAARARRWRERELWRGALAAAVCLLPYLLFRLSGPVPHPQSGWFHSGLEAPMTALARFTVVVLLGIGHRFFSAEGFAWKSGADGGLEWAGQWTSPSFIVDEHTHLLAWGILLLAPFTWWRKAETRVMVGTLSAVCVATMLFLSLVIACLPELRGSWETLNEFTREMMARYLSPVLLAWFAGLLLPWLREPVPLLASATPAKTPTVKSANS